MSGYFVTGSQRIEMRRRHKAGESKERIARDLGFCSYTIWRHLGPAEARRREAERIERLFAACNRALAEARP